VFSPADQVHFLRTYETIDITVSQFA
jgi:hypothetical protein